MDRRTFVVVASTLLAAPRAVTAQHPTKVSRIGMLLPVTAAEAATYIEAFRQGLRELGYAGGRDIGIEYRFAAGEDKALPALAAELIDLQVEVIVTWGTPATFAAKNATKTIPIVTAAVVDPVGTGLVESLARPGGNVTGVSSGSAELSGKNLQLLTELIPGTTRVAVLWNRASPSDQRSFRATEVAANALGVRLHSFGASNPTELGSVLTAVGRARAPALFVIHAPWLLAYRKRIVDFAAESRLPAMYERREWVEGGGLMSYGVSFSDNFRRAATHVDKILKGATPAHLPVEQPTKFELVINIKTAKALGLMIPSSLLMRADQVIQ